MIEVNATTGRFRMLIPNYEQIRKVYPRLKFLLHIDQHPEVQLLQWKIDYALAKDEWK